MASHHTCRRHATKLVPALSLRCYLGPKSSPTANEQAANSHGDRPKNEIRIGRVGRKGYANFPLQSTSPPLPSKDATESATGLARPGSKPLQLDIRADIRIEGPDKPGSREESTTPKFQRRIKTQEASELPPGAVCTSCHTWPALTVPFPWMDTQPRCQGVLGTRKRKSFILRHPMLMQKCDLSHPTSHVSPSLERPGP
ncbi:hypothetical protein BDY21DRAFT_217258 [Lineolata rhizophorae]|uniref:Uncharacterized protein n=1 Tax=Lineolata rhizophorae TaxID=578093 RepID=A0A6A6P3B7_9PEZI|nr:hypothetical protein BDY21DRAFT_217258 [Lineolata rhizophorae]